MSKSLNSNGLVNGNIPKGQPCPFHVNCKMGNERCPVEGNTKEVDFSCAAARAHSMVVLCDSTLLRSIFDKRFTP